MGFLILIDYMCIYYTFFYQLYNGIFVVPVQLTIKVGFGVQISPSLILRTLACSRKINLCLMSEKSPSTGQKKTQELGTSATKLLVL